MKNHDPPLNNNKIERLFSHNNKNLPLDKHYNQPLDHVLHEEFDKAILALTIDPTKQQEITIKKQQKELSKTKVLEEFVKMFQEEYVESFDMIFQSLQKGATDLGLDFSDEAWKKMKPELQRKFKKINQEFLGIE